MRYREAARKLRELGSKYAELCGALGIRVTEAAGLDAALERALAHDGPALVEVMADPELV
jgi:thiamine pyrophosphate-dependent acetolactate synthase large subunit-like protein